MRSVPADTLKRWACWSPDRTALQAPHQRHVRPHERPRPRLVEPQLLLPVAHVPATDARADRTARPAAAASRRTARLWQDDRRPRADPPRRRPCRRVLSNDNDCRPLGGQDQLVHRRPDARLLALLRRSRRAVDHQRVHLPAHRHAGHDRQDPRDGCAGRVGRSARYRRSSARPRRRDRAHRGDGGQQPVALPTAAPSAHPCAAPPNSSTRAAT